MFQGVLTIDSFCKRAVSKKSRKEGEKLKPLIKDNLSEKDSSQINELYEWLKEKRLTAGQAIRLLNLTEQAIFAARQAEADKMAL